MNIAVSLHLQVVKMSPLCYLLEDGSIADDVIKYISAADAGELQCDGKEPLLQLRFSSDSSKYPTVMERALLVRSYRRVTFH